MTAKTIPQHSFFPSFTPKTHERQESPHIHQVVVFKDEIICCDLGNDCVWRLRLGGEEDESRWVVKDVIRDFEDGDGPRHAVVHPGGQYYTIYHILVHLDTSTSFGQSQYICMNRPNRLAFARIDP